MKNLNLLALKECFKEMVPNEDSRSRINPFDFVVALVFSFLGDSKSNSIESIRRSMMIQLNKKISRHAFWERFSRKRLKTLLQALTKALMSKLGQSISIFGKASLSQLGISDILLIDSCTITLWDGASDKYPGTRTAAGKMACLL